MQIGMNHDYHSWKSCEQSNSESALGLLVGMPTSSALGICPGILPTVVGGLACSIDGMVVATTVLIQPGAMVSRLGEPRRVMAATERDDRISEALDDIDGQARPLGVMGVRVESRTEYAQIRRRQQAFIHASIHRPRSQLSMVDLACIARPKKWKDYWSE